jgi:hypothetical protein
MAVDARRDPATRTGALKRIGEQRGINPLRVRTRRLDLTCDLRLEGSRVPQNHPVRDTGGVGAQLALAAPEAGRIVGLDRVLVSASEPTTGKASRRS